MEIHFLEVKAAWKVSVLGVSLVRVFPHLDWIHKDTEYFSVFSLNSRKNVQKNSKHGQFSRSVSHVVSLIANSQSHIFLREELRSCHCVKSVLTRSFSGPCSDRIRDRMRENTDQRKNADTFYAVCIFALRFRLLVVFSICISYHKFPSKIWLIFSEFIIFNLFAG